MLLLVIKVPTVILLFVKVVIILFHVLIGIASHTLYSTLISIASHTLYSRFSSVVHSIMMAIFLCMSMILWS